MRVRGKCRRARRVGEWQGRRGPDTYPPPVLAQQQKRGVKLKKELSQMESKTVIRIKSETVSRIKSETTAIAELMMPIIALALYT